MELQGKIKKLTETQTYGENGFQKRELVLTTNENYPQMLLIEFVQDKCILLNDYNIGDEVNIAINIRGKEWISPEGVTKYFTTFQGWKINKITTETTETTETSKTNKNPTPSLENNLEGVDEGDLPF